MYWYQTYLYLRLPAPTGGTCAYLTEAIGIWALPSMKYLSIHCWQNSQHSEGPSVGSGRIMAIPHSEGPLSCHNAMLPVLQAAYLTLDMYLLRTANRYPEIT